jgi:hypothetical protein
MKGKKVLVSTPHESAKPARKMRGGSGELRMNIDSAPDAKTRYQVAKELNRRVNPGNRSA